MLATTTPCPDIEASTATACRNQGWPISEQSNGASAQMTANSNRAEGHNGAVWRPNTASHAYTEPNTANAGRLARHAHAHRPMILSSFFALVVGERASARVSRDSDASLNGATP